MEKDLVVSVVLREREVGSHKTRQKKIYEVLIFNDDEYQEFVTNLWRIRNYLLQQRT
jgi:hypothetical protein